MKTKFYLFITSISLAMIITCQLKSQTWTQLTSGTTNHLLGISAPSASVCYVSGSNGIILKTIDGGVTWLSLATGTTQDLHSIYFINVNSGFAVGNNGAIIKTIDGGSNWLSLALTAQPVRFVYFFNSTQAYITGAGGLILKTTDGGNTWSSSATGTTQQINDVYFTSASTGYASGFGGVLLKSTDGGSSWSTLTSGVTSPLGIVLFTSVTNGIVIGDNGVILKTINSGTNWTNVSSGVPSDVLTGMDFMDANNGFIVGGNVGANTGTILATSNEGSSWSLYNPGTSRLVRVDFANANTAYAVGLGGTILKWSSPVVVNNLDARFTSSEPGCLGQQENFYSVMAVTAGVTHSWNFGLGATPATSSLENPTGIVYATSGAKLVTHIVTSGGLSDTVINIITINPSPTASFISTAPACLGATVNFTNTGSLSPGVTYSWDFGVDAIPAISTAQNPTGITYRSSGTKTVTLAVSNQLGCVTLSTQTITINPLPIAFAGIDTTICANTSIQLGATAIVGNTYKWFPSSTLNNSIISNPIASPIAPITQYIVSVKNTATGCKNADTVNVTMLAPLVANAGIDGEICRNEKFQLGTGLLKGQIYSWSPTTSLSDSTLSNPIADPDSTTTYTLTVTGSGCSAIMDEVTILVHQLPIVNAGKDDTTTVGKSIQLTATGGLQYMWSPVFGLDNSGIYNPMAQPDITTTYVVTVTDIYKCVNTDTMKLTVIAPKFWVPTAFTPDGNGISDVFYVRGEGIQNFEFSIFNRWGEQIFLSKTIDIGWDGTRQASEEKLPEGAYVYHIRGALTNGDPIDSTGLVNLIR